MYAILGTDENATGDGIRVNVEWVGFDHDHDQSTSESLVATWEDASQSVRIELRTMGLD